MEQAGLDTAPYHVYVPSFGEWGFVLAGRGPIATAAALPAGLRFLTPPTMAQMFEFPSRHDPGRGRAEPAEHQALVRYYEREWSAINR